MEVLLNSFLLVAATEMGDKTQLLALVLASRFKKPFAVLSGILVATILNHALAAYFGAWVTSHVPENTMRWILGISFFVFAAWVLVPDKDEGLKENKKGYGAFLTTLFAFFIAEMGDKTQLSTVALAANYKSAVMVTIGTTLGMMFSDGLAVVLGKKLTEKIPMKWIRIFAALLFVLFGLGILFWE